MPEASERSPIQRAWLRFVQGVHALLVPRPDDRPLDQYLAVRDAVVPLVQSETFLTDLQQAWGPLGNTPLLAVGQALLLELEATSRALEVAQATTPPNEATAGTKASLGRASIVCGSVKDLVEALPAPAKAGLTLLNEVIDLFS